MYPCGIPTFSFIMYGLPSPHNSESSSAMVKKKTRTDVVANLFMRVYFGITRKQVIQE